MSRFNRREIRFDLLGIDLVRPADACEPGFYPVVENAYPSKERTIRRRDGLAGGAGGAGLTIVGGQSPAHTIRQLNDPVSGASTLIVGTGTHLATAATDLTSSASRDTGYSGDPLHMASYSPIEALAPSMYVADRLRMRKISTAGAVKPIGLPAPVFPPVISAGRDTLYTVVDTFDSGVGWSGAPIASNRVNTTVTSRIADGFYYWVEPASMANIGVGTIILDATTGINIVVVATHPASGTATTISRIIYDSGTTGACTIYPAVSLKEFEQGGVIRINSGGGSDERVRILAVITGPDGSTCLKCTTTNAHAAGESLSSLNVFEGLYGDPFSTINVGDALTSVAQSWSVATSTTASFTRTVTLDLSRFGTFGADLDNDEMHISVYASIWDAIDEIRIAADVDRATNNFTQNYYERVIRQNDLLALVRGDQTAIENQRQRIQRLIADGHPGRLLLSRDTPSGFAGGVGNPIDLLPDEGAVGDAPQVNVPSQDTQTPVDPVGSSSSQGGRGQNQYVEIRFKLSELKSTRVGEDKDRTLKDVRALRLQVKTNSFSGIPTIVNFDSWWVGGGYAPDIGRTGAPYQMRYRVRDPQTGAVSNWSPPSQSVAYAHRQKINASAPAYTLASNATKVDWQRIGGTLLDWAYVGTSDLTGGSLSYQDDLSDDAAIVASRVGTLGDGNTHFQPWPILSSPIAGTASLVAGTMVRSAANDFPLSLAPGTAIRVGSRNATVYRIVDVGAGGGVTNLIETYENLGGAAVVAWEIPQPTLLAQPKPVWVGPFQERFFTWDGHLIRWTNRGDPDSTTESNRKEVSSPSEPGVALVLHGERLYAATSERLFEILPTTAIDPASGVPVATFTPVQVADVGAFSTWASSGCTQGPFVGFLGKDGVYASRGGSGAGAENITSDPRVAGAYLRPLFPRGGVSGEGANGFNPVDQASAQAAKLRLAWCRGDLHFDYIDTSGARRSLVHAGRGWLPMVYTQPVVTHYAAEGAGVDALYAGGADGKVYRVARDVGDAGATFVMRFDTASFAADDQRGLKVFGDGVIDANAGGATVGVIPYTDNYSTALTATNLTGVARVLTPLDWASGGGVQGRNIGLRVTATVSTQTPELYLWEPAWAPRPEITLLRATDYEVGERGVKWVRGVWIEADTRGVSRSAVIEYLDDSGTVQSFVVSGINHAALTERFYPIPGGLYMISARLRPTDAGSWSLVGYRFDAEAAPPLSTQPTPWLDLGHVGAKFVQGVVPDGDTNGASVDFTVQGDEEVTLATITGFVADGRAQKPFTFNPPFITHLVRLVPSAPVRLWLPSTLWHFQPEPDTAEIWQTQQTTHGMPGWKRARRGFVTVKDSTAAITLRITADGVSYDIAIPESAAVGTNRRTLAFDIPALKYKVAEYRLLSAGNRFRLYRDDCAIYVKPWDGEGEYAATNPFGDVHNTSGARI